MQCSSILTHPTVIYKHASEEATKAAFSAFLGSGSEIKSDVFAASLEEHIRTMVSSCAWQIHIPAYTHSCWATPARFKSLLTPTFRKRIHFVDVRNFVWTSILNYFAPMIDDIPLDRSPECRPVYGDPLLLLGRIASDFYNLVLATQYSSEVQLSPKRTLHMIGFLLSNCGRFMSAEGRNRLTVIESIFALFKRNDEIPGFVCIPLKGYSFSERINEVLEDADLQQASAIRRFFSVNSNVASIRRDLRLILKAISKNKSWAKGAVDVSSQVGIFPKEAGAFIDKLLGALPTLGSDVSAPVLIDPYLNPRTTTHWQVIARKDIYDKPHGWCMEGIPIWGMEDNHRNQGRDVFVFSNKYRNDYVSSVHVDLDTSLKKLYEEKMVKVP